MSDNIFAGKKLLITGGTGSFGNAVLRRFLDSPISEIRIFSRDEKKQDDMRKRYKSEKVQCYLGDVREPQSLLAAVRDVDYIFHAAALKQVPSCEFHPIEAVKTNILGTENVLEAGVRAGVEKIVCLSTDKAVYPINAMGISKAMMEKVVTAKARSVGDSTMICATRYGNVMGSRGSVIPLFLDQIRAGIPMTVTDCDMTRFMMTLEDAVDLVIFAFLEGASGDIFVQKAPAATIQTLVSAMRKLFSVDDYPVKSIGTRHGEKLFETLCSTEEMQVAEDMGDYYRIPSDMRGLNYEKYFDVGRVDAAGQDYTSHNTSRLDVAGMQEMLMKLDFIRLALEGKYAVPYD